MNTKHTDSQGKLSGVIQVTKSGKGFLLQSDTDDIEIPQEWVHTALSGDVVEIARQRKYGKLMGRVVRVIERKTSSFVGELVNTPKGVQLKPDNGRIHFNFAIEGTPGTGVGNKVVGSVVEWESTPPRVKIERVLGPAGDHETEMHAILVERGFESDFPPSVKKAADELYENAWDEKEIATREDFRDTCTLTIDPEDAKDFDDAISLKELPDGSFEVGVHIADVSHFVQPGGAIDREAYDRGTSVYLVDRTIPMLPPQLSEDLCSLRPEVDRLAFSAIFTINTDNEVVDRRFVRGIIRSQKRFVYDDADIALKDAEIPYHKELNRLWDLARTLRENRKKEGAIMFETPEIKPVLNEKNEVSGFKTSEYTESHQLIEELMLLANREVASFVTNRLGKKNLLFIYRVHDTPDTDRLDELSVFLRAIGYNLKQSKDGVSVQDLNQLLMEAKGTPEEQLIQTATVRTMSKAIYATKNIGHFGLAFANYTHFTSPIRRYPDLIVHRILGDLIEGKKITIDPTVQAERAIHTSAREAAATEAERTSVKLKQVEYFANHIGEAREGVVSGVTDWGIYIRDNESAADGMIRLATLNDDHYTHDRKTFSVIGERTGKKIQLGDPVTVVVDGVNIDDRTIDFKLKEAHPKHSK
ncbi:MAG: ribonuclease R [Patescibacteria group bacterium UBA2163]